LLTSLKDLLASPWFPVFRGLLSNLGQAFRGWKVSFMVAAVAVTFGLVLTGLDSTIRAFFEQHHPLGGESIRWTYFTLGQVWHVFLGLWIFRQGFRGNDLEKVAGGSAVLQSLLAVNIIVGLLKVLTGRPAPEVTADGSLFFRFNWAAGDVMWPSGHTASAFALAAALHAFYRDRRWVPWTVYPLATFVGLAMLDGLFHWASDVAAGLLLGIPVGLQVGREFRRWHDERRAPPERG
jgi:membrane-associated phospholipid phosphatase